MLDAAPEGLAETEPQFSQLTNRLQSFLREWRTGIQEDSLTERVRRFVARAGPMLHRRAEHPVASSKPVDVADLRQTLATLHVSLCRVRSLGVPINPWIAAGLKRSEMRNAAALSALWSPASGGDVAKDFLGEWLERLRPQDHSLPDRATLARGYVIRTEHCPTGAASERVDLTIEGADFLIGIEVKIGAGLQHKQLERYKASIAKRAAQRCICWSVIFLSPYHPLITGVSWSRWRDIAAAGLASLPLGSARSFNHRLVEQFAAHAARLED